MAIRKFASIRLPAYALGIGLTTFFAGCFGGDDSVSSEEAANSERHVQAGSDSLNSAIAAMTGGDYAYGKENLTDLQAAHREYAAAAAQNPSNSRAKFGEALTGVLLAAQNQQLADLINNTLEAPSLFDSRGVDESVEKRAAVLKRVGKLAKSDPAFHEVQDAVATILLPAMEKSITLLTEVYQDAAFTLNLTLDGKVYEIDHAEAGLVLAGMKALHGYATLCLSYDIDIDQNGSYAYLEDLRSVNGFDDLDNLTPAQSAAIEHITTRLAPGSTFLAVRPAWQVRLSKVTGEMIEAAHIAKASLASIRTEADPQADDLIRECTSSPQGNCIDTDNMDLALDNLDSVSKYLQQPFQLQVAHLDTALTVDFTAYFKIQDFKKMLPRYGFYPKSEWSNDKPIFFFADDRGSVTGTFRDVEDLQTQYENGEITGSAYVDALHRIIHFQDPTFQGYLPGATEAGLWNLIRKQVLYHDDFRSNGTVDQLANDAMNPQFIFETSLN